MERPGSVPETRTILRDSDLPEQEVEGVLSQPVEDRFHGMEQRSTMASELKRRLREEARRSRLSLSPQEAASKSLAIAGIALRVLREYRTVLVYASKAAEVDTRPLMEGLLKEGKRLVVPIIVKEDRSLRLSFVKDLSVLVASTFSVPEPLGNEIEAGPEEVQAAIIPVLAFDPRCHRLGYGAGYYDRFLKKYPHIVKIGAGFSCQQVAYIPSESHDVRMDAIVTEDGVLKCGRCRNEMD